MAGESQYYNPIIEAMIASANQARLKAGQEQRAKEHDVESKQRDIQLKQAQQQIDQEHQSKLKQHEIAAKQLEIQRMLADSEAESRRLQQLKGVQELLKVGGPDLAKKLPGLFTGLGQPQGQQYDFSQPSRASQLEGIGLSASSPDMQESGQPQFDFSSLYSPEIDAANIKREAAAKAGGAAEGTFEIDKKLLGIKTASEAALLKLKQDFEKTENKLDRQSREYLGRLQASAHLQAAGLGMGIGSSSALKGMVQGALTGRLKLDGSNPIERAALGAIVENGGKPLDPKEVDTLRQSQQLSPIFDRLDKFAEELPDTPLGVAVNQGYQTLANKAYTTKLQNEINILRSQAVNIGRALEGMTGGRVLVMQMQTDLDSFASNKVTKEQMKDRIKNLRDFYINKVDEMYLQGVPTAQRLMLYHDQGIMPGYVALAPKVHPQHPDAKLDVEASIKEGEPVYKRSTK